MERLGVCDMCDMNLYDWLFILGMAIMVCSSFEKKIEVKRNDGNNKAN